MWLDISIFKPFKCIDKLHWKYIDDLVVSHWLITICWIGAKVWYYIQMICNKDGKSTAILVPVVTIYDDQTIVIKSEYKYFSV